MDRVIFQKGIILNSNTEYFADENRYDFYPKDLAYSEKNELVTYFSMNKTREGFAIIGENLENVTLDFCGAVLCIHDMATPIAMYKCKNLTIKNVSIRYDRPLFSECTILETGENYARVHFNENFPVRCENGQLIPYAENWEDRNLCTRQVFFQFFDADTFDGVGITLGLINPTPGKNQDMCFGPVIYSVEQCGDDVIFRTVNGEKLLPDWQVGRILAIEHADREHPSVFLHTCENVTLENVRLINTCGMGIQPFHTHNLYINGLMLKHCEESTGVINHSADALHAISCSGDLLLCDSIIGGCIDDAVNIHDQYMNVTDISENIVTLETRARGVTQYANICDVGDMLAFYRGNTMEIKDEAQIVSKKIISPDKCEIVLSKAVNAEIEDTVENITVQADVTFKNTVFEKTNTHIRMQTRGKVLIEDCVTELPIIFTGDMNFWYESSPCKNVTIRHTFFAKPQAIIEVIPEFNPTDVAPYYHENINIEDCMFVSDNPLRANHCNKIKFMSNRNANGKPMKLTLEKCGDCFTDNSQISKVKDIL